MCDYTQVEFRCGHVRYTVRAWCTNYETTHKRCPPTVVAIEFRYVVSPSFAPHSPLIPLPLNLVLIGIIDWMNDVVRDNASFSLNVREGALLMRVV
jgi:hypothetical protein